MVSFMKKIKYKINKLEVHQEERGWLVNLLRADELEKPVGQIHITSIKPGYIRGNHYHSKRMEWFFIITGKAKLCLQDTKDPSTSLRAGKSICLNLSEKGPKVITIFPGVAHAVKNVGKEMVYLVSAQSDIYNPKSPDAFRWEVIK